jgi:hypothetical protein
VREIICTTGLRGEPVETYFEDREVILGLFMDYYVENEPESCFVAEVCGKVEGHILCCKDTKKYQWAMVTRIGPRLLARVFWRLLTFRYRRSTTYRTLWWAITRAWREVAPAPADRYPAHAHFGIHPRIRRREAGLTWYVCLSRLVEAMVGHLGALGVSGVHGRIPEAEGEDIFSRRGLAVFGFRVAAASAFSLWEHATGKRWYLKLLVKDLRRTS